VPKICTNVSPPQRGGAVPAPLTIGGPKWRDNYPERSDHPITPQRLVLSCDLIEIVF